MKKYYILSTLIFIVLFNARTVFAQADRVTYSGLGRSIIQNDKLGSRDTGHANKSNSGYTLVDQAFNVKPNSSTEIQAIVRFNTQYGGFYGEGASVTFRQLYIRGTFEDNVKYQFGDINIGLTKFTLHNNDADGNINEASAFKMLTDISNYENFNFGNLWRQQGMQAGWLIPVKKVIESVHVNGFITRNRMSNISSLPEQLYGGGNVTVKYNEFLSLGGNYVNLFSLAKTLNTLDRKDYQNPVLTGNFKVNNGDSANIGWYVKGETGQSLLKIDQVKGLSGRKEDFFYEVNVGTQLRKQNISLEVGLRDVGPEFYSAGAQSKRINFGTNPALFSRATNLNVRRGVSLFDITRDKTVYNQVIAAQLMSADITLSNVLPYGDATPNRNGITFKALYSDSASIVDVGLDMAMLKEIRGEGTVKLRNFMLIRAKTDFYLNRMINWTKIVKLTLGLQLENTSRDGDAIETVSLASNIIDAGLDVEVFKNFDIMLGAKLANSKGNEYGKVWNDLNELADFIRYTDINVQQRLVAVGLRYRFSPNIDLSIQGQTFNYENSTYSAYSYDFRQIFVLFNMKF